MRNRLTRGARFFLERWLLKGVFHQLLMMSALIAMVALAGGLAAWGFTPAFESLGAAIWWAFLRLTDPGYLGDDTGAVLRVIATIVTILGYVMFMGSLIAIMTQWLTRTIRTLESGLTPIRMQGHVIILGWTNRTPEVVAKLLDGRGRLERFLKDRSAGKLRVVILSEHVGAERRLELREYLGAKWDESQVFLRSGSSLQQEHLKRLDLLRASVIIVPGADFELGGADASDTRVVKTLLTLNSLLSTAEGPEKPHIVCEMFDALKQPLVRGAVESPVEVIASNRVVSRLISQSIRHRGLSRVLMGLLSHRQGNSLYLRGFPQLAGTRPLACQELFPKAVVLGVVRREGGLQVADLDPRTERPLEADDLLVLLAEKFEDCDPLPGTPTTTVPVGARRVASNHREEQSHRILVLGWSHKIGALVSELSSSHMGKFTLTILSRVGVAEREQWMTRVAGVGERVEVRHVEGDYALQEDMMSVDPSGYDNVLFMASEWMASSREADARTILGYVLLLDLLKGVESRTEILVELLDPDNTHLFAEKHDVYLFTPRVLSFQLAHIALRPELNVVFNDLFGAGGVELDLFPAAELELDGQTVSFHEIQARALECGVIALGVALANKDAELNPERTRRWTLTERDFLVVLNDTTPEPIPSGATEENR